MKNKGAYILMLILCSLGCQNDHEIIYKIDNDYCNGDSVIYLCNKTKDKSITYTVREYEFFKDSLLNNTRTKKVRLSPGEIKPLNCLHNQENCIGCKRESEDTAAADTTASFMEEKEVFTPQKRQLYSFFKYEVTGRVVDK